MYVFWRFLVAIFSKTRTFSTFKQKLPCSHVTNIDMTEKNQPFTFEISKDVFTWCPRKYAKNVGVRSLTGGHFLLLQSITGGAYSPISTYVSIWVLDLGGGLSFKKIAGSGVTYREWMPILCCCHMVIKVIRSHGHGRALLYTFLASFVWCQIFNRHGNKKITG